MMESPVRICLGAALVVNLLLLYSAPVEGVALPNEITPSVKNERPSRFKANATWPAKTKPKNPDIALNELNPKDSTSEEHTEKNAKYKDRGRLRFGSRAKASTASPKRRSTSSTETATLVIVTPTPEVKKPAQIIDSMRHYKKTKLPVSTTTPVSIKDKEDDNDSDESFEKFTSDKYHDNFFTLPSFDDDHDFGHDSDFDSSNNKVKKDYSAPYSFSDFSKENSYGFKEDKEPYKSSFFDFDAELTTPKNDFFDKKYKMISSSIKKNLDSMKANSPPPNVTNIHKIVKNNIGLERLRNNTPSNKSSVFIKNTKEIRTSDNEGAGSAKTELSDVHGTSIYYEMSETYTVNSDDDCDDSTSLETTYSTSPEAKIEFIRATQPTIQAEPLKTTIQSKLIHPYEKAELSKTTLQAEVTKPTILETKPEILSTLSSNFLHISSIAPYLSTTNSIPYSTQGSISSTERVTKLFSNYRNRTYSKRLNLTGTKDSPNSVTPNTDGTYTVRPLTRKFHYTTPKIKPVWMSPRRNISRTYSKPTSPKTIYSEHFSIKDKFSSDKPSKTILTTVASAEIDPVLQTDVIGTSKVVNSQFVTDNTIPALRKRGSMRFKTTTASSAEVMSDLADLEMPSTVWALTSLISIPSLPSTVVNETENELQKVGELKDKKETTTGLTSTSTVSSISNDIITKKVTEVNQNKLPWPTVFSPTVSGEENKTFSENKEKITAESNISLQSSVEPVTTEAARENRLEGEIKSKTVEPLWIPATVRTATATDKNENKNETTHQTIPPIDASKSTGFESITKLSAGVTTPQDETTTGSEVNQTVATVKSKPSTEYEITTIRFSYVPTEAVEDITNANIIDTTTEQWHSMMPTRTKETTITDTLITTYRPIYLTSTEIEETTTVAPDTTPVLKMSSQIANATEKTTMTTEVTLQGTETTTTTVVETTTTAETVTEPATTIIEITTKKESTPTPTTELTENTTITVIEVKTEINTDKSTLITMPTIATVTSEMESDSTSEENSQSNEINYDTKTQEPSIKPETTSANTAYSRETTVKQTYDTTIKQSDETTMKDSDETVTETDETAETERDETEVTSSTDELTSYAGEMTTEAAHLRPEEAGSGAAIAIAVSTIGVIALVLLIGLLLVVRRRGRRGVYAQRCTPVSLDAYSLDSVSVSVGHRKGNHRLRASKRSYGNPAYDDEVTSHPMQYPALASFALDMDSMSAEFAEIPSVTVKGEEVPPGCEDKNRYSNVLPLPETRVPLQRIGNDPTTEYINANFVTGPGNIRNYYILAQAPLSNTVVDFWRMIWEQNSRLVVMLTEYMENGVEKCYEYLPPSEISDNRRSFGDFKIILKKREQRDKYAISTIQLINLATRTWREVTHLWYFWPAKGVPEDYDSVIDFLFEMRSYMKVAQTAKEYDEEGVEVIYGDQNRSSFNNLSKLREENGSSNGVNVYSPARAEEQMRKNNGTLSRMKAASEVEGIRPCVVTCASGAGRSAAVTALDVTARALAAGGADVPRTARALRAARPHSLTNRHHYIWLYKVLSEYGNKIMGGSDNI